MKATRLHAGKSGRVFAVVLDKDEDAVPALTEFAKRERLAGSQVSAIGAFRDVVLGYFDRDRAEYRKIPIAEQVEVVSLLGDIAIGDRGPTLHLHVVVAKSDGTAHGGHLLAAHVWPTLEVVVTESPTYLRRRFDPETRLGLISIPDSGRSGGTT